VDEAPDVIEAKLEHLTRAYGSDLFARLEGRGPVTFSRRWWDDRLMDWTMAAEAVKLQLFRFVDVLPLLNTPETISRHLHEYFEEANAHLPGWARLGMRWLPRAGLPARVVAWAARVNATRLARRFIAGSNVHEALTAIADLRRRRLAFTVDLLGEATITEAEAVQKQQEYVKLIEGLSGTVNSWQPIPLIDRNHLGPLPRVNMSIKLSTLYSQFDPVDPEGTSRVVRERLRPILHAAKSHGAFIHFDMEQYAFKDLTLCIFREILEEDEFRDWPDAGIALQAYLRDCERDLLELSAWARKRGRPVWVRLIKGAYWDYETVKAAQEGWRVPVFTHKWETDANYEKLTRLLLENHEVLRPAFGSHNVRSLAHALACARDMGLPPNSFEVQMLYGMAEPEKEALADMGVRVRVYTPYGELLPGMAYLVRRLLENTANDSFLRANFTEHVPEEQLLMNPMRKSVVHRPWSVANDHQSSDGHPDITPNEYGRRTTDSFRNEPLADFTEEEARQAMQSALKEVKKAFGRTYLPIIGNSAAATASTIHSVNPSRMCEIVGCCGRANLAQAQGAVVAARAAFAAWRDTDPGVRADYLVRAAGVIRRRRFELAAWEVYECGKAWREADADVAETIDYCEYYAREMRRLAKPRRLHVPGEENEYFYEPRGVAVVIAPWNFPLAILAGMTTAALVTGNTVVMKPAEQSSVIGAKLMEVFQEIGLPPGVVNFLPGIGEEVGPALVEHPDVALIAFTGSRGVGLSINREAAEHRPGQDHIKRVIAEMGGKNAVIVDDDADLDEAVSGVAASAFGYQGQKCSACSRAIVLEAIYDAFLARLVEATRSMKIAPADDPGCSIGPVIDAEARQRILDHIARGKQEARLAYAGDVGALADEGYFIGPHIFADVLPGAIIAQEEIFGPVLAAIKVRDLDEALAVANGTSYALTGGLYSRSPGNIRRVKHEFRVGNLYINRKITGALVERQPFGGFKMSGIGSKAGGPDYLLQFVLPRAITENTMRRGFAPAAEGAEEPYHHESTKERKHETK
jgi:RHH-type proline utilization regulon transcriptional repressor/proline dehydrogenase/delta 1-pyrroline-5-carboxylate dehydrogenase